MSLARTMTAAVGAAVTALALTPAVGAQSLDPDMLSGSAGPAPAHAPVGGARVVVLGDSIASGTNVPVSVDSRRCVKGAGAWPAQLAAQLGLAGSPDFVDQSCPGSTIDSPPSIMLTDQARSADALGAFGPRTEQIMLQFGFNDVWGTPGVRSLDAAQRCWVNLIDGCDLDAVAQGRSEDPAAVTGSAYAARIRQVVAYVRHHAPNARISIVGYPDMLPPQRDTVCMNILGLPATNPRGAAYRHYVDALQEAQRGAAGELGLTFVDLRAATAGHGPCTAQPWIDGVLDFRSNPLGAPFHMTPFAEGVTAVTVRGATGI